MAVKTAARLFGRGMNQTTDDRLLEPGTPRSMENLVVLKNGRLGMRFDYDALANTLRFGTNLQLFDLWNLGDRLLGAGTLDDAANVGIVPTKGITDCFEFLGTPFPWGALPQSALSSVQHVRNVGAIPLQVSSVTKLDVAAGSGFLMMAWSIVDATVPTVIFAIFNATTSALIDMRALGTSDLPRCVFLNGSFYLCTTNTSTNAVNLRQYTVSTGVLTSLTDPDGASANAVIALDMSLDREVTSFWIAFGRIGGTTRYYKYNNVGTQLVNQAGPAVLINAITVYAEQGTGGQQRMHLALVLNATTRCRVDTILIPTLVTETSTADQFGVNVLSQVGMTCLESNVSKILCLFQITAVTGILSYSRTNFITNTHVLGFSFPTQGTLSAKLLTARSHGFFAITLQEGANAQTNLLRKFNTDQNPSATAPACAIDRLIASSPSLTHLPNLALDASTSRLYWGRLLLQSSTIASPLAAEMEVISTNRRQVAQAGNILYAASGIVQAIDGNSAVEAGGFLVRPTLTTVTPTAGGSLTLLATYQIVAVFEVYDSRNNRIQSAPSEVLSVTLTGANQSISLTDTSPVDNTFWRLIDQYSINHAIMGTVRIVYYRTLPTNNGNLTFFRDPTTTGSVTVSDATLQTQEVLYTQGARGSLSGPLSFVTPQPATTLAVSADRVTSGGLPDRSTLQESRPQFPAEQVNWSDSIAFLREVRGDILLVMRLDERRLAFTANEIFELDGEGVDDNGNGDIGAGRRLPSDVGLFGGVLGWRSAVEFPGGVMFQGSQTLIYLLPRGGTTPIPKGLEVQDKVAAFPTITAAIYLPIDKTIRFCCNNVGLTDSIVLLYDVVHDAWSFEGPFGVPTASAARLQDRMVLLQNNVVKQQRASHPPAAFIANAWRSGLEHPAGTGGWSRVHNFQFYGGYLGNTLLRAIVTWDDTTREVLQSYEINDITLTQQQDATGTHSAAFTTLTLASGDPISFKFTPNQMKCESFKVDFEVDVPFPNVVGTAFNRRATQGTSLAITLPTVKQTKDRGVMIVQVQQPANNVVTPPAGWVSRAQFSVVAAGFVGFMNVAVFERINFDGSEGATATATWVGNGGASGLLWLIRNSHESAALEVQVTVSPASVTTLASPSLTPSWGLTNTLYLTAISLERRLTSPPGGNVQVFPQDFGKFFFSAATDPDPLIDEQIEGGSRALAATSITPTAWGWKDATPAEAITIAVRPSASLQSAGLLYHHWEYDYEVLEGSARKAPNQMG